jgi:hypothetical protein
MYKTRINGRIEQYDGISYRNNQITMAAVNHNEPDGGVWHKKWQLDIGLDRIEKAFEKCHPEQYKNRRTDAVISELYNAEIQHSYISLATVRGRRHDHGLHGKFILWIIDGNYETNIHDDIKRIEFCGSSSWKRDSFIDYIHVFVEHRGNIYVMKPIDSIDNMCAFATTFERHEFLRLMLNGDLFHIITEVDTYINQIDYTDYDVRTNVEYHDRTETCSESERIHEVAVVYDTSPELEFDFTQLDVDDEFNEQYDNDGCRPTAKVYVKQQGAGNGKTYGIIQLLQDTKFDKYDTFIYLTKQHSAVHVIHSELNDQKERHELDSIKIEKLGQRNKNNKKYTTEYVTNDGSVRNVIIGTFDSFIYAVKNEHVADPCDSMFISMAKSIVSNGPGCDEDGCFMYASKGLRFDSKLLIIGDELQDLEETYSKAIMQIVARCGSSFYAVGDKLQSIMLVNNAFTYLTDNQGNYEGVEYVVEEPSNICRRWINNTLTDFVNKMINFNKHGLRPVVLPARGGTYPMMLSDNAVIAYARSNELTYQGGFNEDDILTLMGIYEKEVTINGRTCKDFLVVTPLTSRNPLVNEFNSRVRAFWANRNGVTITTANKYSVFHTSQSGSSINLAESENATRMVSIHSSKGDGRPVVILVGLNENTLLYFCEHTGSLIYESLIHVALTRQKQQLYILYDDNGDDISNRMAIAGIIRRHSVDFVVKRGNLLSKVVLSCANRRNTYAACVPILSRVRKHIDITNRSKSFVVDMEYHGMRYNTFNALVDINILAFENKNEYPTKRSAIRGIIESITRPGFEIKLLAVKEYSKVLNEHIRYSKDNMPKLSCIPILKYNNKCTTRNMAICEKIVTTSKETLKKLRAALRSKTPIELTPLEACCANHIMDIYDNGNYTRTTINTLYDLFGIYVDLARGGEDTDDYRKYLKDHMNMVSNTYDLVEKLFKIYPNVSILKSYMINSTNNDDNNFKVMENYDRILYDDHNVIIVELKPSFNDINKNDIMIGSIYKSHLLKHINNEKFAGKRIQTCVLTFDMDCPYYIDWRDDKHTDLIDEYADILNNSIADALIASYKTVIGKLYNNYLTHLHINDPFYSINKCIDEYDKICAKQMIKYGDTSRQPAFIASIYTGIRTLIETTEVMDKTPLDILNKYADLKEFTKFAMIQLTRAVSSHRKR